jgi:hypothetical protein
MSVIERMWRLPLKRARNISLAGIIRRVRNTNTLLPSGLPAAFESLPEAPTLARPKYTSRSAARRGAVGLALTTFPVFVAQHADPVEPPDTGERPVKKKKLPQIVHQREPLQLVHRRPIREVDGKLEAGARRRAARPLHLKEVLAQRHFDLRAARCESRRARLRRFHTSSKASSIHARIWRYESF